MRNIIQLLALSWLLTVDSFEPARATNAAREWRFRPARRKGKAVSSVAYIVFGFREPVVSGEGAGPTGATHSSRSATSDPPP